MDENYNLDIFEMMARTSEPTKELIRKKNSWFTTIIKWMSKISNVFFNGKISMKLCFLLLDFWHVKS
jgi:hypothetical protein